MKPAFSGCILSAVTMEVGTGSSVGVCDSKMAHSSALFLCPVPAGACKSSGELATVDSVVGLRKTSLGVG